MSNWGQQSGPLSLDQLDDLAEWGYQPDMEMVNLNALDEAADAYQKLNNPKASTNTTDAIAGIKSEAQAKYDWPSFNKVAERVGPLNPNEKIPGPPAIEMTERPGYGIGTDAPDGDDEWTDEDLEEDVDAKMEEPDMNEEPGLTLDEVPGDDINTGGRSQEPFVEHEYVPEGGSYKWYDPRYYMGRRKQPNYNDLNEPLLGDVQMTELEPPELGQMMLSERPTPAEASPSLTPQVREGFNRLISDAEGRGLGPEAIAQEMGIGIGSDGGLWISRVDLKGYLAKQGKGLLMAPAVFGLTTLLNEAHDGLGDAVSLGMIAADLITTGDPLGILMYGVGQAWTLAAESRQKTLDNDEPDKEYGSRIGYVREGDKWYPAIYNQRYKSTGIASGDSSMTLDYGHEIIWKLNGEGDWTPMIPDAKSKQFVLYEDEWDTSKTFGDVPIYSKDMIKPGTGDKMNYSTRDWYFLSPEDAKKVASGEQELNSYEDDLSGASATAVQLNDWRKALETSQDWKWSDAVATMGKGAAVNNYEGSRELNRLMWEGVRWGNMGVRNSTAPDFETYVKDSANRTGEQDHGLRDTFGDYIMDTVLKDHMHALYQTQKLAAEEQGFGSLYGDSDASTALYLDTAKDMATASTAAELHEQLHQIDMMDDRSPKQRNYLAQKAQMRYWMQQTVQMGSATDMMHHLMGRDMMSSDPYGNRKLTTAAAEAYVNSKDQLSAEAYSENAFNSILTEIPAFAMPWQNAGEGYMPTLSGVLAGTANTDYLDDFHREAYDRLSKEMVANTTDYIDRNGHIDPNAYLEGNKTAVLQGRGIYHTDADAVTLAYDEYTGEYVRPGEGTANYTKFNPETGDYELTQAGKDKKTQDEARDIGKLSKEAGSTVLGGNIHDDTDTDTDTDDEMSPGQILAAARRQAQATKEAVAEKPTIEETIGDKGRQGQPELTPEELEKMWKDYGVEQNFIDPDTRPTDANSHGPDTKAVATEAVHVVGNHAEAVPSFSTATYDAIAQWEGHSHNAPAGST